MPSLCWSSMAPHLCFISSSKICGSTGGTALGLNGKATTKFDEPALQVTLSMYCAEISCRQFLLIQEPNCASWLCSPLCCCQDSPFKNTKDRAFLYGLHGYYVSLSRLRLPVERRTWTAGSVNAPISCPHASRHLGVPVFCEGCLLQSSSARNSRTSGIF